MKKLTTYASLTGNTKKIAYAIYEQIGGDIMPMHEADRWNEYDFLAIGFYIDKGFASEDAKIFLKQIKNKKIGIFFTLGAESDSEHAKEIMQKAKEYMLENDNEILCDYASQGAISPELIENMKKMAKQYPDNEMFAITPKREKRWEEASTHPDENDLQNAKKAFLNIK